MPVFTKLNLIKVAAYCVETKAESMPALLSRSPLIYTTYKMHTHNWQIGGARERCT